MSVVRVTHFISIARRSVLISQVAHSQEQRIPMLWMCYNCFDALGEWIMCVIIFFVSYAHGVTNITVQIELILITCRLFFQYLALRFCLVTDLISFFLYVMLRYSLYVCSLSDEQLVEKILDLQDTMAGMNHVWKNYFHFVLLVPAFVPRFNGLLCYEWMNYQALKW